MNFGELKTAAVTLAERPDQTANAAWAVNRAQRQLQRKWTWRCMESDEPVLVAYPAGTTSVLVADDCKEIQRVWLVPAAGDRKLLVPTTDREATQLSDLAARAGNGIGEARWYERAGKLVLLWPPEGGAQLAVEYARFLPSYVQDSDSDWFAERLADVLTVGAAAWLLQIAQERSRCNDLIQLYWQMAEEAWVSDRKIKTSGLQGSYSPPLPGGAARFWRR